MKKNKGKEENHWNFLSQLDLYSQNIVNREPKNKRVFINKAPLSKRCDSSKKKNVITIKMCKPSPQQMH